MRKTARLLLAAPLLLLASCALDASYRPEITPLISQKPATQAESVAVLNFRLEDTMKGEGPTLANYVAGALAREGYGRNVDRIDAFVADSREAAKIARDKGFSVAVFGTIDDFVFGGITTNSKAVVSLYAIEAETGKPLWRISGQMVEPPKRPEEKFIYLDNGAPAPTPMKLSILVVSDMARVMTGKPLSSEPQEPPKPKYGVAPRDQGGMRSR